MPSSASPVRRRPTAVLVAVGLFLLILGLRYLYTQDNPDNNVDDNHVENVDGGNSRLANNSRSGGDGDVEPAGLSEPDVSDIPVNEGNFFVKQVIDGDTVRIADGRLVRLIGVNSPEMFVWLDDGKKDRTRTEPFAEAATSFTERFVGDGNVQLQFDRERIDKFDRVLAYLYRDGRLLNEELVRNGLAEARLHYDYAKRYKDRFKKAEEEAKQAKRGVWSKKS